MTDPKTPDLKSKSDANSPSLTYSYLDRERVSHGPEPDTSLFLEQDDDTAAESESVNTCVSSDHLTSLFTWKTCGDRDRLTQVRILEDAVRDAEQCLFELEKLLIQHSKKIKSTLKWIDRIGTIREAKKECRILIGFLGATGAGKSSLINALLDSTDILPVDDERACTAVCVEILWNTSEDPASRFKAKIDRISREDWNAELERLLKDISDDALNLDGENGEPDLEREERIKTAFQKLRCVYPHIRSRKDLSSLNPARLLEHPNVKDILGSSKTILCSDLQSFSTQIKPYIDSSSAKEDDAGKSFAQWPLVKVVRLKIKSNILKHGIVLVDLPGNMDTNAARGAIADEYQKNLTMTCIVAPISRAASDKPAQDLLGRVMQRNLQFDNHFSSEHLCFIVTKSDASLEVERYIKTHDNVADELESVFHREKIAQSLLRQAQQILAENQELQRTKDISLKSIRKQIRQTSAAIKSTQKARGVATNKRKRDASAEAPPNEAEIELVRKLDDLKNQETKAKADVADVIKEFCRIEKKLKEVELELWKVLSSKTAACIANRNGVSQYEIRTDFDSALRQMGQNVTRSPLQVFCVSAVTFSRFSKDANYRQKGFARPSDTGVPALRKWLIETTLPIRNQNATSYLEANMSFQLSMKPWLKDSSAEFKLTNEQRGAFENEFEKRFAALTEYFATTNMQTVENAKKLVQSGVFSKLAKIETQAATQAERTVRGWASKPIVWSTHRAINRKHGHWTSSKGIKYAWNEDLAGDYLDPLLLRWTATIHKKLLDAEKIYADHVCKFIIDCVSSCMAFAQDVSFDMVPSLQRWSENAKRTSNPLREHAREIFHNKIQDAARVSWRLLKPEILRHWMPVYDKCAEETGTGHFKRNQATHLEYAQETSLVMYKKGGKAIQNDFKRLWITLPAQFNEGTEAVLQQIKEDFEVVMENHTLYGDKEATAQMERTAKARLQEDIISMFQRLHSAWQLEDEIAQEEVEEEEPEDNEIIADGFFDAKVDDDDEVESSSEDDENCGDEDNVDEVDEEYVLGPQVRGRKRLRY